MSQDNSTSSELTVSTPSSQDLSGSGEVNALILLIISTTGLLIVAFSLKKKFRLPLTPSLIGFGILLRVIGVHITELNNAISLVIHFSVESIYLGLFPVIIFESTLGADWHLIKKELFQITLLSTTFVVSSTILNAAVIKSFLFDGYPWANLLIIGVIISATDHVAVDALLKDVPAEASLKTLISGETMFNETSIFVLFKLFIGTTTQFNIGLGIQNFLRISLGGLAFGIAACIIAEFFLKRIINNLYLEVNLTLTIIYLTFWLCEYKKIEFSGAFALVTFGLYMSAYGKTKFSPLIEAELKAILENLVDIAESIIFIISGITFTDITFYGTNRLNLFDYFSVLLVFLVSTAIRGAVLAVHFPVLKFAGSKLTWKELIILTVSGAKGAIAIGLSIVIFQTPTFSLYYRSLVFYLGIGNSILSILLGTMVTRKLHEKLGLQDLTDAQIATLIEAINVLDEKIKKKIDFIRKNKSLNLINWEFVDSFVNVKTITKRVLKKNKKGTKYLKDYKSNLTERVSILVFSQKFVLRKNNMDTEVRRRYLCTLKDTYWKMYKQGYSYGYSVLILIRSCSYCLDNETQPMDDWKAIKEKIIQRYKYKLYKKLSKSKVIGRLFKKKLYYKIMLMYDAAVNFIQAHQETERMLYKLRVGLDIQVLEQVISEGHDQIDKCVKFLNKHILDIYPEIVSEVQTKRFERLILYYQRQFFDNLLKTRAINKFEYTSFINFIDSSLKKVDFSGLPSMPSIMEILANRFPIAFNQNIYKILEKVVEKEIKPGKIIFRKGDEVKGAFFIVRGRVNEKSSLIEQELIVGSISGVQHLLPEYSSKYTTTATALTYTLVALIPKEIIEIQDFHQYLYGEARKEIILLNRERYDLINIKETIILSIIKDSKIKPCGPGQEIRLKDGALILTGTAHRNHQTWFIRPRKKKRRIKDQTVLMKLPKNFRYSYTENDPLSKSFKNFCINILKESDHTVLENNDFGQDPECLFDEDD